MEGRISNTFRANRITHLLSEITGQHKRSLRVGPSSPSRVWNFP